MVLCMLNQELNKSSIDKMLYDNIFSSISGSFIKMIKIDTFQNFDIYFNMMFDNEFENINDILIEIKSYFNKNK